MQNDDGIPIALLAYGEVAAMDIGGETPPWIPFPFHHRTVAENVTGTGEKGFVELVV